MVHSRGRTPSQVFRLQSFSFQHCLHTTPATICIRKTPLTATPTFIISGLQLLNGWHMPGIFLSLFAHLYLSAHNSMLLSPLFGDRNEARDPWEIYLSMSHSCADKKIFSHIYIQSSWFPFSAPQTLYSSTLSSGHVTKDSGLTRCTEYCRNLLNCSSTDQQFLNPWRGGLEGRIWINRIRKKYQRYGKAIALDRPSWVSASCPTLPSYIFLCYIILGLRLLELFAYLY